MKIYSKSHFTRGCALGMLAILSAVVLMIKVTQFPFAEVLELGVLALICFFLSANSLYIAFSKSYANKEAIEEYDERALLIKLKSESKTYLVMNFGLLTALVGTIIFYSVTKQDFIIPILLTLTAVWGMMSILKLIISIIQEKKINFIFRAKQTHNKRVIKQN